MNKQILTLMIGAAVLSISPVFAMNDTAQDENDLTRSQTIFLGAPKQDGREALSSPQTNPPAPPKGSSTRRVNPPAPPAIEAPARLQKNGPARAREDEEPLLLKTKSPAPPKINEEELAQPLKKGSASPEDEGVAPIQPPRVNRTHVRVMCPYSASTLVSDNIENISEVQYGEETILCVKTLGRKLFKLVKIVDGMPESLNIEEFKAIKTHLLEPADTGASSRMYYVQQTRKYDTIEVQGVKLSLVIFHFPGGFHNIPTPELLEASLETSKDIETRPIDFGEEHQLIFMEMLPGQYY